MSTFDATSFMQTTTTDANDTKLVPVPEGEYVAVAKLSEDPTKPAVRVTATGKYVLDIQWLIDDPEVKRVTGMTTPSARQSVFLDVTERGTLDMSKGKNVQLGKVRDAVDLNVSGQPFSLPMLSGKVARVLVKHRATDEGDIFADVKGVAHL